VTEEI